MVVKRKNLREGYTKRREGCYGQGENVKGSSVTRDERATELANQGERL